MKAVIILLLLVSQAYAQSLQDLELIRVLPHKGRGEGLDAHEGYLWETEAYDRVIRKIDPETGRVVLKLASPTLYPESLFWMGNRLIHNDFKRSDIAIGRIWGKNKMAFELLGKLPEIGFGMVKKNDASFWVTGYYSNKIYLYSYPDLKKLKTIETKLTNVEDMAWDGESLWTSDFNDGPKKLIYRIDPENGNLLATYKLPGVDVCDNTDGITIIGDELFVTGKNCPLYVLKKPN